MFSNSGLLHWYMFAVLEFILKSLSIGGKTILFICKSSLSVAIDFFLGLDTERVEYGLKCLPLLSFFSTIAEIKLPPTVCLFGLVRVTSASTYKGACLLGYMALDIVVGVLWYELECSSKLVYWVDKF